jgi:hypothetical protein
MDHISIRSAASSALAAEHLQLITLQPGLERRALTLLMRRRIPASRDGSVVLALQVAGNRVVGDLRGGGIVLILQIAHDSVARDDSTAGVVMDLKITVNHVAWASSGVRANLDRSSVVLKFQISLHSRSTNLALAGWSQEVADGQVAFDRGGGTDGESAACDFDVTAHGGV